MNCKCDFMCYDCPNKWTTTFCDNEDAKYERILDRIHRAINTYGEEKFHIPVDWQDNDIVAMNAWKRIEQWLTANGYVCRSISFVRWLVYRTDGKPAVDCGSDNGTAYIRKVRHQV